MTAFLPPRRIALPDRRGPRGTDIPAIHLAIYEAGAGPAVVMCHGFPELAYSWRHQVAALAEGGFRAIAVDQRGYGESDRPDPVEDYDLEHLTSDMAGVLDELGIEKAVFAGHDWGGFVAWAMPVLYPERTLGVIGVNTPNFPFPTTKFYRTLVDDDDKMYILWFQKPGVAETFLDQRPRIVFDRAHAARRPTRAGDGARSEPRGLRQPLPGHRCTRDHWCRASERGRTRLLYASLRGKRLPWWDQLVPQHRSERAAPSRRRNDECSTFPA